MASRSIDLISKKTNCMWSTLFFLISKKTNLHVQHAFCLFLPLFCTTTMPFCRTKTSNFLLTHYFYGGIVIYAYPIFCLLCLCQLLFFTAASISHCLTAALNFHVFPPTKFVSFVFNHSLLLFLSNNGEKDTTLLLFFLSKKKKINKSLSCIWVAIPVD